MFFSWSLAEAWAWLVQLPYLGGAVVTVMAYVSLILLMNLTLLLGSKRAR